MRYINMQTWSRREHFKVFNSWDYPHFNMCANVDLTAFLSFIKEHGISFNVAFIYVIARTANSISEFRQRIRGNEVVEHDMVHPSSTILVDDAIFTFCTMKYFEDFPEFSVNASKKIAHVKEKPSLQDNPGEDDLLFMTAIPWVSFTSFMHPLKFPVDSVPRFAWGKFYKDGDILKIPLSIQGHHAVMDGVHVGRYYEIIQDLLNHPEAVLGEKRERTTIKEK